MTLHERITWAVAVVVLVFLMAVFFWLWDLLVAMATVGVFFADLIYRSSMV